MAIEWQESLATGVREIDDQHKELFRRVNSLLTACTGGRGKDQIPRLVDFLAEYVVTHFGAEEDLMNQYNYPESPSHKALHAEFSRSVAGFRADLAREGTNLNMTVAVNRLVVDWLVRHIGKTDKALGAFLTGRT